VYLTPTDALSITIAATQFGLLLPFAFVLETFFGISLPSAKVVDFSVKTSGASAATAVKPDTANGSCRITLMRYSIWRCYCNERADMPIHR
jgi:hypothetical protein